MVPSGHSWARLRSLPRRFPGGGVLESGLCPFQTTHGAAESQSRLGGTASRRSYFEKRILNVDFFSRQAALMRLTGHSEDDCVAPAWPLEQASPRRNKAARPASALPSRRRRGSRRRAPLAHWHPRASRADGVSASRQGRVGPSFIPVLVRAVDWQGTALGKRQALPLDGSVVSQSEDRDGAWLKVVRELREMLGRAPKP